MNDEDDVNDEQAKDDERIKQFRDDCIAKLAMISFAFNPNLSPDQAWTRAVKMQEFMEKKFGIEECLRMTGRFI